MAKYKISYKNNLLIAAAIVFSINTFSQKGIGTNSPNSSAALDITSTNKGLLIPRMTSTQRTNISTPAEGLRVYDITTKTNWYFNGTVWVEQKIGTTGDTTNDGWLNVSGSNYVSLNTLSDATTLRDNENQIFITDNSFFKIGGNTNLFDISSSVGAYPNAPGIGVQNYNGLSFISASSYNASSAIAGRRTNKNASGDPIALSNGDIISLFGGFGYNGSTTSSGYNSGGSLMFVASENYTSSQTGTRIAFQTVLNGTNSVSTSMVLSDKGNLGLGSAAIANPLELLDIRSTNGNDTKVNIGKPGVGNYGFKVAGTGTGASDVTYLSIGQRSANDYEAIVIDGHTGNFVGIGTNTPTSKLDINGSISKPINAISTSIMTLDESHHTIIITDIAVTQVGLPVASNLNSGRIYKIINHTASTPSTGAGNYIDLSGATQNTYLNKINVLQSDGSNWYLIGVN